MHTRKKIKAWFFGCVTVWKTILQVCVCVCGGGEQQNKQAHKEVRSLICLHTSSFSNCCCCWSKQSLNLSCQRSHSNLLLPLRGTGVKGILCDSLIKLLRSTATRGNENRNDGLQQLQWRQQKAKASCCPAFSFYIHHLKAVIHFGHYWMIIQPIIDFNLCLTWVLVTFHGLERWANSYRNKTEQLIMFLQT